MPWSCQDPTRSCWPCWALLLPSHCPLCDLIRLRDILLTQLQLATIGLRTRFTEIPRSVSPSSFFLDRNCHCTGAPNMVVLGGKWEAQGGGREGTGELPSGMLWSQANVQVAWSGRKREVPGPLQSGPISQFRDLPAPAPPVQSVRASQHTGSSKCQGRLGRSAVTEGTACWWASVDTHKRPCTQRGV